MYNRITDPSSIHKAVLPVKENEPVGEEYLEQYGEREPQNRIQKILFGKAVKIGGIALAILVILGALYYLLFHMDLSYVSSEGLSFQVTEYSAKDKILTVKISGASYLPDDYSGDFAAGSRKELYLRLKKPFIDGRQTKTSEKIYLIYMEDADSLYFLGKEGEEPIQIWSGQ